MNPKQNQTPLFNAVKKYVDDKVIQFHVPGHKQGRGLPDMQNYIGAEVLKMDANGMDDLDYFNNPTGVILEAEKLMADAFGADYSYFLVNGTTSGVQAMILSTCEPGSKIILPRNAHRSTIGGLILSGAIPVYVQPEINNELGIAMGVSTEKFYSAIAKNPCAKAVFLINPTYYGAVSDLKRIIDYSHSKQISVLVDEAHGAHMHFNKEFPITAMDAGADMSAASIHKTGGSLTQSSALFLKSSLIKDEIVRETLNLMYTSSASYILMCSLDIARKQLATNGEKMLNEALELSRWARDEINKINGLYAFGRELIGTPGCYNFDETKLGINVIRLGYTGYQMETKLRKEYNIQVEMSDLHNILAIVSIGDRKCDIEALVNALKDISYKTKIKDHKNNTITYLNPEMIVTPREAFYNIKKTVSLHDSVGEIAGEMIMAYPPGIPVISLGERITKDIIDYIEILKSEKCQLQGTADPNVNYIRVLGSE